MKPAGLGFDFVRDLAVEASPAASAPKKFGTFLGVFTPSILTILGVIMYQRLGWVTGQVGLIGALGIVLVAHTVSLTTGLSVASIATNHTVKAGGNYYIISRSLGLPIGGSIGLALYIALSLSVSLYLIGFAEAFIAAMPAWVTPFHNPKDNIRLIGTVACVGLVVLSFLSTSIALRSQVFVFIAISVSLLSIFLGSGPLAEVQPQTVEPLGSAFGFLFSDGGSIAGGHAALWAPPGGEPIERVFAVFFPAVTGFTAGVGMSGDLKDPKRAIPIGTMGAILAGLAIYLALPVFLTTQVPLEALRSDYDILRTIALEPRLVTVGVWAATLSSAVGSLLGAPRTLKALADDGIGPKVFGKGKDEPRVALMVTFVLAEAGILVAELDAVGAVITMVFLTCYGVLCLACGLERWASPDFRPQFKVPAWVSLFGALVCFMLMFQLDPVAMMGALIIMIAIYVVLKRRQLVLDSGDAWAGVWSAFVRFGLTRLEADSGPVMTRHRRWRPNMVAISRERPNKEVIDLSRMIVGTSGILTHFTLVEGGVRKAKTDTELQRQYPGLFARTLGCDDALWTVPSLAANFGLAGMEANSVMVRWPRESVGKKSFGYMYSELVELDVNVFLFKEDKRGFEDYQSIDIWWDGRQHTGELLLTVAHLLQSTSAWKKATFRVLVPTETDWDQAVAKKRLSSVINASRVKAEGVLLAPLSEEQSIVDRVKQYSASTSLVVMTMPQLGAEDASGLLSKMDEVLAAAGSCLLVRASRTGVDVRNLFDEAKGAKTEEKRALVGEVRIEPPGAPELAHQVKLLEARLTEVLERFDGTISGPSSREENHYLRTVAGEVDDLGRIERRFWRNSARPFVVRGHLDGARSRFSEAINKKTKELTEETERYKSPSDDRVTFETRWRKRCREGIANLQLSLAEVVESLPTSVWVPTEASDWAPNKNDGARLKLKKLVVRMSVWAGGSWPARRIPFRTLAEYHLGPQLADGLLETARELGLRRLHCVRRGREILDATDRSFLSLLSRLDGESGERMELRPFREVLRNEIDVLRKVTGSQLERLHASTVRPNRVLADHLSRHANALVHDLTRQEITENPGRARSLAKVEKQKAPVLALLNDAPRVWDVQHQALAASLALDVQLRAFAVSAQRAVQTLYNTVVRELETGPIAALMTAEEIMDRVVHTLPEAEEEEDKASANDSDRPRHLEVTDEDTGSTDISTPTETEEERKEREAQDEVRRQTYVKAADELRATWDQPYRPNTRELIDQLVQGLDRASERVPESITTISDSELQSALDGQPVSGMVISPARRLAQSFAERVIAEPARKTLKRLPEVATQSQDVLVDACRLVAFDLEHTLEERQAEDELEIDRDIQSEAQLRETMQGRIDRIIKARQQVETYRDQLRRTLLDAVPKSLDAIRETILSSSPLGQRRGIEGAGRIASKLRNVQRQTGRAVGSMLSARTRAIKRPSAARVEQHSVDDLLALREQMLPNQEIVANLPLTYRRVFGRAPIDTSALAIGRDLQLEDARRLVGRWTDGSGGPIGIIGDPRSGRSSIASIMLREMLFDRVHIRVRPPAGGTAEESDLNAAVVKAVEAREGQSAEAALRAMAPGAVILIDELGRWIERNPRGLSALELWMKIWSRLGDRHLFILTATPYAWKHVDQLSGMAERFLGTLSCSPVSAAELRELITLRQRTSGFELKMHDERGRARGGLRARQFARVWRRSGGNIGDALDLWRRSVVDFSESEIRVRVDPAPSTEVFSRLPVRWYAALVAVALHRALTVARMARVMRVPREEAQVLLTDLGRAGLLTSESGLWTLDPVMATHVIRVLRARGMLP